MNRLLHAGIRRCTWGGVLALACSLLLGSQPLARAQDKSAGYGPTLIKRLPDGIQLETHWGQSLVVGFSDSAKKKDDWLKLPLGTKNIRFGQTLDHGLDRKPNEMEFAWKPWSEDQSEYALRVQSTGEHVVIVNAAGVTIQLIEFSAEGSVGEFSECDVLVACGAVVDAQAELGLVVSNCKAKKIVVAGDLKSIKNGSIKARDGVEKLVSIVEHNATSATYDDKRLAVTGLSEKEWEMPKDMLEMFEKMAASCERSQEVFAKLSAEQLNFKPANGTHTPRWNCEHMMGRQLGFFSQIYNAIDPTMPVMNLNPKQMPPDYEFAHPDWSGIEEAAQMQRVSDFTRRFAYLLDGQELGKRAPGSRWPSLGALLRQMERHYDEHTANTVKKFELPGWPEK